jgi:hypothetical protein
MRIPEGQTPVEVAELIRDVIEGKVVCDIGCGGGSFMQAMAKYAKEVTGIEEEKEWAQVAADKGFTVQVENVFSFPLPEADVYYCWNKSAMGVYLKAKYEKTKGTFIFGHTVRPPLLNMLSEIGAERRGDEFNVYITEL